MRLARWLIAALGTVIAMAVLAPGALAQQEPPPEPPPAPEPDVPDLILSGRAIRMTRAGIANVRIGCRSGTQPGEACIGTLTLRLATDVMYRPPRRRGEGRVRTPIRVLPFNLATRSFQLGVGRAAIIKLRVTPRTGDIVRQIGSIPLRQIGVYVSRAGMQAEVSRGATFYYPNRPPR